MKQIPIMVAVAIAIACGSEEAASPEAEETAPTIAVRPVPELDPALVERGQELYATHCALCHGENGEGYANDDAPALANPDFLAIASDAFLEAAIKYGRPGTPMSAWSEVRGGPLDDTEVDAVVARIRSWQTEPGLAIGPPGARRIDRARVERGRSIFAERCAECHGDNGEGATAVTLDNPYFLTYASDEYLRRSIAEGREGTPMQSFSEVLSEEEIGDLVALLRSWERTPGTLPPARAPEGYARQLVVNPDGEPAEFAPRENRFVPADDVKAALDEGRRLVLLDARATSDWLAGHIPGSIPVPFYDDVTPIVDALPDDGTWIIVYCACPHAASGVVVDALREKGFEKTAILDEGVLVWEERGYPIERAM